MDHRKAWKQEDSWGQRQLLREDAQGLKEGAAIKRGDVIGYVGTTGNAPRNTPHLLFAIFKMTDEKKWWQGTAIDPYSVLK